MELRYTFDSERFYLGTLCRHKHAWPGTNQSLRRSHPTANNCVGCAGRKQSDWLLSFLDYESMGWPKAQTLGRLCKSGHTWNGIHASLRSHGHCIECEKLRKEASRKTDRRKTGLPRREVKRLYKAKLAAQKREQGLTTRGTVPLRPDGGIPKHQAILQAALHRAIRAAGRSPSVARLVMDEQKRYWVENPEAKAEHDRRWAQASWWLEYQIRPDLRLYHREKSKRRKAQNRGQTAVRLSTAAIRQRFNDFGNSCSYCGAQVDMEIEHVVAISRGGAHDIGNIVPACKTCNTSKRATEMERWYRSQPFFSELRLRRIRRVLHAPMGQQLAFALR